MTELALLPHLTDPELAELESAVEARIDALGWILQSGLPADVEEQRTRESRAVCRSLLTAIAEARIGLRIRG